MASKKASRIPQLLHCCTKVVSPSVTSPRVKAKPVADKPAGGRKLISISTPHSSPKVVTGSLPSLPLSPWNTDFDVTLRSSTRKPTTGGAKKKKPIQSVVPSHIVKKPPVNTVKAIIHTDISRPAMRNDKKSANKTFGESLPRVVDSESVQEGNKNPSNGSTEDDNKENEVSSREKLSSTTALSMDDLTLGFRSASPRVRERRSLDSPFGESLPRVVDSEEIEILLLSDDEIELRLREERQRTLEEIQRILDTYNFSPSPEQSLAKSVQEGNKNPSNGSTEDDNKENEVSSREKLSSTTALSMDDLTLGFRSASPRVRERRSLDSPFGLFGESLPRVFEPRYDNPADALSPTPPTPWAPWAPYMVDDGTDSAMSSPRFSY